MDAFYILLFYIFSPGETQAGVCFVLSFLFGHGTKDVCAFCIVVIFTNVGEIKEMVLPALKGIFVNVGNRVAKFVDSDLCVMKGALLGDRDRQLVSSVEDVGKRKAAAKS